MGEGGNFPSAIFTSYGEAEKWIMVNKLTGSLNEYPIDIPVYDWAIKKEYFEPKRDNQKSNKFIQRFTSASMNHWHFEDGFID